MPPIISRRSFLAASAFGASLLSAPRSAIAHSECKDRVILNPIIFQRADPHIFKSNAGHYYFTASVPEYDRVILRSSDTISGLGDAIEKTIWRRPTEGVMGGHIWAPEIHRIDDQWLIYFAAGNSDELFHIRTYVLACEGDDPMRDEWSVLGQLETQWDTFTLDAHAFNHLGVDFLCWAQQEPGVETNSNLYLAPLATPTTFAKKPIRLTVPTLDWETQGYKVNEGAAFLAHGDKVFLTYSGSATDDRYAMGLLWADAEADLMDPANWSKSQEPVFVSAPEHCIFGPGHNSFTKDECGRDMLVFHARSYQDIEGDPLYDPNRHARVQPITFDDAGFPVFGKPAPNGPLRLPQA